MEHTNADHKETLMEFVYYNIYREHMMGLPILGVQENIRKINRDMVMDFHSTNYFGENIVIVGTGNVVHEELVDLSEKHFGHLKRLATKEIKGTNKAEFHPGLLCVRDENIDVSNVGVFYNAPSWSHPDFYGFLLLQRMFGEYEDALQGAGVLDVSK